MLKKNPHPSTRDADLQRYLHGTLGVIAKISGWEGDRKTPYYLRERTRSGKQALIRENVTSLERAISYSDYRYPF
jgi:hypothetical protein